MPFSDPIRQREHQREGARRRRAAKRLAAEAHPQSTEVVPVSPAPAIGGARDDPVAAVPMPTDAHLDLAGRVLSHARSPQESAGDYRARLRDVWRTFLEVVEGVSR